MTDTKSKNCNIDLRYNYNAFTCGHCGKRHPHTQHGEYHTYETWLLNDKKGGRPPSDNK